MNRTMKNKKGFTLMEMLIVIAIIAVLVAIAIPIYSSQMHKAKVSADWANLRAYYAELQLDYLTSGAYTAKVPVVDPDPGQTPQSDYATITFLNGDKVKLQAGHYAARWGEGGYHLAYQCSSSDSDHDLVLGG